MNSNFIITEEELGRANMVSKPYDSIFHMLFKDKKHLLKMYQTLHPEDMETTEDDLEIILFNKTILRDFVNDLSFTANDRILVLFEAQSTECANMPLRLLIYLAKSIIDYTSKKEYNLFRKTAIKLPKIELYVLYTCETIDRIEELSFSETYFPGERCPINLKVKVLYGDEKQSIIYEYVTFCKVLKEQVYINGANETAVKKAITICKDKGILEDFLKKMDKEVARVVVDLFNEEYFIRDLKLEAKEETQIANATNLIKQGKLSLEDIAEALDLEIAKVQELAKSIKSEN